MASKTRARDKKRQKYKRTGREKKRKHVSRITKMISRKHRIAMEWAECNAFQCKTCVRYRFYVRYIIASAKTLYGYFHMCKRISILYSSSAITRKKKKY